MFERLKDTILNNSYLKHLDIDIDEILNNINIWVTA